MYKAFNETTNFEEDKTWVNSVENKLTNLIEMFKNNPTSDVKKIRNKNHMLEKLENYSLIN